MSQRFFITQPPQNGVATLLDQEAHHLSHVMRAKVGEQVTLFDGSGFEYVAKVAKLGRHDVQLAVLSSQAVDRELASPLVLSVALPRGERQGWLVEKAVELGVSELVPVETERGVAQPTDKALERLRRAVIEAAKQCGRNRLMNVTEAKPWREFIATASTAATRVVAHPYPPATSSNDWAQSNAAGHCLAVGPEGGLTDQEVELASAAGWQLIALGHRILRVETAAIALAAVVGMGGLRGALSHGDVNDS